MVGNIAIALSLIVIVVVIFGGLITLFCKRDWDEPDDEEHTYGDHYGADK